MGLGLVPVDFTRTGNVLYLTAAYADRYQDQVRTYGFANVALTETRLAQVEAEQSFANGVEDDVEVQPSPNSRLLQAVEDSLATIAVALRLVAATFGLAALAVVGLLTVRLAREVATDRATLIAIGWTKRHVMGLAFVVLAPALLVGLVFGMMLGVVASPNTSLGLAATVDPAGRSVVLAPVLVTSVGLIAATVLAALAGFAALQASRPTSPAHAKSGLAPPLERPLPARSRDPAEDAVRRAPIAEAG